MKNRKLHTKILFVFTLISAIFIFSISTIIGIIVKNNYETTVHQQLKNQAEHVAIDINKELELYFRIVNTNSVMLSSVADPTINDKIRREQVINLLAKNIEDNNNIIEIYTVWEKNMFDNHDSLHVNAPGCDSLGRFAANWRRLNTGKLNMEIFDFANKSLYYTNTKDRILNTISKTYLSRSNAEKVLIQPMISPILFGNKFLGIVGIEINTNWVQNYLDKMESAEYKVAIIADDGTIIALSGNPNYKGSFLNELFLTQSDDIYFKIKKGIDINQEADNNLIISKSFYISETERTWHSVIIYPSFSLNLNLTMIMLFFIISALLLTIVLFFIYNFYLKFFLSPLGLLVQNAKHIERGEINRDIKIVTNTEEFLALNASFNDIKATFINIKQITEDVVNEEYRKCMIPASKQDVLRNSINEVLVKLNNNKIKILEKNQLEARTSWVKQGIAYINESIRINSGSIDELADVIVSNLAKYMNSLLCGLFIYKEGQDGNYLETISTYAYDIKKSFKTIVRENEGLVGTCAIERKKIYITKVPENYISVASGLGVASPKSLLLLPLEFETEFLGVIELAFFRELQEHELEFAEHTIKNIASAIKTVKISLKTTELIEKLRTQNELMTRKERELAENVERQRAIQKQAEQYEAELKSMNAAINNTFLAIEFKTDGNVINANEKYLNAMYFSINEITSDKIIDHFRDEIDEQNQIINYVAKGNFTMKTLKRYTRYGDTKWLLASFTPFYDGNQKINKIICFAIDMTENINKLEELDRANKHLNNEVDILRVRMKTSEEINNFNK